MRQPTLTVEVSTTATLTPELTPHRGPHAERPASHRRQGRTEQSLIVRFCRWSGGSGLPRTGLGVRQSAEFQRSPGSEAPDEELSGQEWFPRGIRFHIRSR